MAYMVKALRSLYPTQRANTVTGYDNSGYVLLQKLVEHVSGLGFEAYVRRHLFRPMGMASSNVDDRRVPAGRLTRNYQAIFSPHGKATGLVVKPREFVNAWGAGSIVSSARDMTGYLKMLVAGGRGTAGRVLRSTTLRAMWTRQSNAPLGRWNCCSGLGWTLNHPAMNWAGPVRYKGGDTQWAHAFVMVLPRSGLGVAVLTNTEVGDDFWSRKDLTRLHVPWPVANARGRGPNWFRTNRMEGRVVRREPVVLHDQGVARRGPPRCTTGP